MPTSTHLILFSISIAVNERGSKVNLKLLNFSLSELATLKSVRFTLTINGSFSFVASMYS
jgi:hypothetical protein